MIKDPIDITKDFQIYKSSSLLSEHFGRTSEPMFWIRKETDGSDTLCLTLSISISAWYVERFEGKNDYIVPDGDPDYDHFIEHTKEQFVDYMSDKYPEYLEWMLFHQEWL